MCSSSISYMLTAARCGCIAVASLDTCSATAAAVIVGPYDFRDAVNADGIAESSHKNVIYSLTWNFTECVKDLINQK